MSVPATSGLFPYKSFGTILASGTETTVYTNSTSNIVFLFEIRVAIQAGGAGSATVRWYDNSAALHYHLVQAKVIPANASIELSFPPMALGPSDLIKVTGAANYDVVVTVAEYGGRSS